LSSNLSDESLRELANATMMPQASKDILVSLMHVSSSTLPSLASCYQSTAMLNSGYWFD